MPGLDGQARQRIDSCADYLLKYKKNMQYEKYLNMGLPIATGVIEGACRYLVKDRMEITGARWGLEGGEAVDGQIAEIGTGLAAPGRAPFAPAPPFAPHQLARASIDNGSWGRNTRNA